MHVFGRDFLEEMKDRFEIDLVGATTIESAASPELERRVSRSCPWQRIAERTHLPLVIVQSKGSGAVLNYSTQEPDEPKIIDSFLWGWLQV